MLTQPPPLPASSNAPAEDWERAWTERQLQLLGRLAEVGLEMTQVVERRAKAAEAAGEAVQGAALAFDRVARAVRMTVMLQSKLIQDLKAPAPAARADDARRAPASPAVRRMAKDAWGDGLDMADDLGAERCERLDDEDDLYEEMMERPIEESVDRICRELGFDPHGPITAKEIKALSDIAAGGDNPPFAARAPESWNKGPQLRRGRGPPGPGP